MSQDEAEADQDPAGEVEAPRPFRRRTPKRVFAAFAGGGAKGFVHVGSLSALRARKVRIVGLSGTSAGAIVAALAAVGFEPDEILHPDNAMSILTLLESHNGALKAPTDLFGPGAWRAINRYRVLLGRLTRQTIILAALYGALLVLASILIIAAFGFPAAALMTLLMGGAGALAARATLRALGGLARLDTLRNALDALMTEKAGLGRQVLMADFDGQRLTRLKIVAAKLKILLDYRAKSMTFFGNCS